MTPVGVPVRGLQCLLRVLTPQVSAGPGSEVVSGNDLREVSASAAEGAVEGIELELHSERPARKGSTPHDQ
jgi:hypothetical protein